MKIFTRILIFTFIVGCTPALQKLSPPITSRKTMTSVLSTNTLSRTRFPSRTKVPTNTITLTPNIQKILQINSISEYLLTNEDNLEENPRYQIVFQNIDIYKEERSSPDIIDLCQLDCESITWDKRLKVTLYLLWNDNNSNTYLQLLRTKIFEIYPGMIEIKSETVKYYLDGISPEYRGWASFIYQNQNIYTEYFATYYGPIIILVSRKTECVDLCNAEYPLPQILLAEMQLEKIFALAR